MKPLYHSLLVATGKKQYDELLQAVDHPSIYEVLVKNNFNRIIF